MQGGGASKTAHSRQSLEREKDHAETRRSQSVMQREAALASIVGQRESRLTVSR